jgi:hypothetical protein
MILPNVGDYVFCHSLSPRADQIDFTLLFNIVIRNFEYLNLVLHCYQTDD